MAKRLNIKDWLLIAAGLYLAGKAIGGYAYKNFSFVSARIKMGALNYNGANGDIFLRIRNNTPAAIPIESIVGSLFYSGQQVAQFSQLSPFAIPANAQTEIQLGFFVPYQGVSSAITNAIASGQLQTFATAKGMARSAGVNIPFEQPISPI